jgi:hypothetical protein
MNEIGQLQFRVGGMTAGEAQTLAREVSGELARHLPEVPRDMHLEEIRVQLDEAQVPGQGSLANTISGQIIQKIQEAIARAK